MQLRDLDIVFVSNAMANGGAARVISVLAAELVARGRRVGVAVYRSHEGEYILPCGVGMEYGSTASSRVSKLRRIVWLRDVARRNPRATIVAFEYFVNMQTIIACAGLPNRVIVSERNDPARVGAGFPNGWLREWLYRRASVLVCQTRDASAFFSNKVRKTVILNPIKEDLPGPWKGERRKTVVSFCRLEAQKNLPLLLRAFARFRESHPDYTLEVYGDGHEHDALAALAEELGLSSSAAILPGRPDVHDAVRDAAMFVLPSDYEGLSNSMLEAMAMGLPVICTDCPCGGARMVIRDGENGLLTPVGDEGALLAAMCRVADEEGLAGRLSHNGSALREALSAEKICTQWMDVIEDDE